MVASVYSAGLDVFLAMARAPRRRHPVLAAVVAVVAVILIAVAMVAVANDGVPHDEDDGLWQGLQLELMLLAGWLLLPAASLSLLGVYSRHTRGYMFDRVPGARLWLAYLLSLCLTGVPAALVSTALGSLFSTPRDLSDVEGAREAFGWLFIRANIFFVIGILLTGLGFAIAVVMLAVFGREAKGKFLTGVLLLMLLVVALPVSFWIAPSPGWGLVLGLTCAGLIGLTTTVLLLIGQRASWRAKARGAPDWTVSLVRTGMSSEACVAVGVSVAGCLAWVILRTSPAAEVQGAEVGFVCEITGCSSTAMTVAGWLIFALPASLIVVATMFWRGLSSPPRVAALLAALLICGHGALFFPGKDGSFDHVTGPGSDQVIGGLGWAGAGVVAAAMWSLIAIILRTKAPALKRKPTLVAASLALLGIALTAAIVRAEPSRFVAADIFPATLRLNGDTLTRTAARDQRGCDGVLPDNSLLNARECVLSVHASYITDDSDAVVTIAATWYSNLSAARFVHTRLTGEVRPVGSSGDLLIDSKWNFQWVAMLTAGHSDGRPITPTEESWVRWPLRQVYVHFIHSTTIPGGGGPRPNPTASPRT